MGRGVERPTHPGQIGEGFLEGNFDPNIGEAVVIHQVISPAKGMAQILNAYSNCWSCQPGS